MTQDIMLKAGIIFIIYLIGAIPFGLIWSKLLGYQDLRTYGSGNIGATNAMRLGGKKLGALIFLSDALKGAIAVLWVKHYYYDYDLAILASLAAVIGHIFPTWLRFRGGKGVATSIGVILAIDAYFGVIAVITWILIFYATKLSSFSALVSIATTTLCAFVFSSEYQIRLLLGCICLLIFYKHKENIRRLLDNSEHKII